MTGLTEHALRCMDEDGTFPAVKTEGGHRRYNPDKVGLLANKLKGNGASFDVELRQLSLEDIKNGSDSFIPEIYHNRPIPLGIVKESDWTIRSGHHMVPPDYPKTIAYTYLSRKPIISPHIAEFHLNVASRFNINLPVVATPCRGHILAYELYGVPEEHFKSAFLWSYCGRKVFDCFGQWTLPAHIFLVLKNEVFGE